LARLLTPLMVQRLGFTQGSLAVGVIWAAWHMPLLLFADYNSGTPWWFSIPCFCALTIGLSVIMSCFAWFRAASGPAQYCMRVTIYSFRFFTPLTGSRGTVTAYVIDEFGAPCRSSLCFLRLLLAQSRSRAADRRRFYPPIAPH